MKIFSQTDVEHGSFYETGAEHFVHYPLNCAPWCRWWCTQFVQICRALPALSPRLSLPICTPSQTSQIKAVHVEQLVCHRGAELHPTLLQATQHGGDLWPHWTNLDFCFNWVLCISALPLHQFTIVFCSSSLACGSPQIHSGSSKAQVNDSGVWLHPMCNHSCRRAALPPQKEDIPLSLTTLQCKTFGGIK